MDEDTIRLAKLVKKMRKAQKRDLSDCDRSLNMIQTEDVVDDALVLIIERHQTPLVWDVVEGLPV